MTVHNLDFVDAIHFSQTLNTAAKYLSATNHLTLDQIARCNIIYLRVHNNLVFNQQLGLNNRYVRNITQRLSFTERARPRVFDNNVYQSLLFRHTLDRRTGLHNQLTFTQTVTVNKSKGIKQTLNFNQTLGLNIKKQLIINQTLVFQSTATCLKMDRNYIAIPIILPPQVDYTAPRLTCNFVCGTYNLTLPAPDFDDSDKQEFTRVNRRTRGGDLIIFRDNIWPQSEILTLRWTSLKSNELTNLYQFIKNTIGKLVTFTTHENRVFIGIIKTPTVDVTESKRQESQTQIDFEVA